MKKFAICFLAIVVFTCDAAFAAATDDDRAARVAFVNEFIRELASTQQVRDTFAKEHGEDKSSAEQMATIIRTATRMNLELQTNINILQKITLRAPFNKFNTNLQQIYEQKQAIQEEIINTASQFMGGPKPNVDYDAMAAHMPQLTAQDGYLEHVSPKLNRWGSMGFTGRSG